MQTTYTLGGKTFILDEEKAQAALAAKRVINGRETMTFNLLPLRYQWAYNLYQKMKANHWEPEDIPMQRDAEQCQCFRLIRRIVRRNQGVDARRVVHRRRREALSQ